MKTVTIKQATPSAVPTVTVIETSDPTAVGEGTTVIEQDAVQLESKPLRARQVVLRLNTTLLIFQSTNLAIRTRTRLRDGFVACVAFGPQAAGTVNGLPIGPDRVLVAKSGVEVEFVVAGGYESVSLLVPPDDIRSHLRGRHREDEFRIFNDIELLQLSLSNVDGLYRLGRRLAEVAARQPEVFNVTAAQMAAQIELLETLLAAIGSVGRCDLASHDSIRQAHSRVVQISEDYVLAHTAERIHVTDLCEAARVSERTLQYAFKEVMGMTPVAYLTRLRLHRVRQSLKIATHASTTVSAEALRWGFWHFGDFSRAYKSCFGELPSDTLREKPNSTFNRRGQDVEG